jgi:hypothetical protein
MSADDEPGSYWANRPLVVCIIDCHVAQEAVFGNSRNGQCFERPTNSRSLSTRGSTSIA